MPEATPTTHQALRGRIQTYFYGLPTLSEYSAPERSTSLQLYSALHSTSSTPSLSWCCSNDDACRSAAPPIAPLPSRRVAASRGQYRWCGGGGSLHRPAAGAAITSMRGGCRRLVWLEAYAAPPKPYCRSSAWRLGRAAVVVADGMAAAAAARPSLRPQFRSRRARGRWRAHRGTAVAALSPQRLSVLAVPLRGVFQVLTTQGDRGQKDRLRSCRSAPT